MIFAIWILSHHYRTGRNSRTVGTLPVWTVCGLDVFLFNIDLGSFTAVADSAVVVYRQPVIGIHRNRVVPRKSRSLVSKLRQRIVHKSRTVDTEIVYRLYRQRSILTLIVCVPISLISESIRRTEKRCRLCDHHICRRKRRVFGRSTCGICSNYSAHCRAEH